MYDNMASRTPLRKEKKVTSLYKKGHSIRKIAGDMKLGKETVFRILKRNKTETRDFGTYQRTKEHKEIAAITIKKMTTDWKMRDFPSYMGHQSSAAKKRGEQLKVDTAHQSKYGRLGGLETQRRRRKKKR
jgi:hypothetical protein